MPVDAQQLQYRHFTTEHGLSQMVCESLFQDERGYLWVGTGSGLNRFTGSRFDIFKIQDGLGNDYINDIVSDGKGNIWVASHGGLSLMRDGAFFNKTVADGLPSNDVNCLLNDRDTLWIGTDKGLARLHGGFIESVAGLPATTIWSVIAANGRLWVGTDQGLFMSEDQGFVPVALPEPDKAEILGLHLDPMGRVWAATHQAVYGLNPACFVTYSKAQLQGKPTGALLFDRDGALWVGTGKGLTVVRNQRIFPANRNTGLNVNVVEDIIQDRDGHIWIAGIPGLANLTSWGFDNYTYAEGLGTSAVRVLKKTRDGTLWAGTLEGLSRFEKNRWITYTSEHGLSHNYIISLHEDTERLWIGTRGGLSSYDGAQFSMDPHVPATSLVYSIANDRDGSLWVSLLNQGLYRRSEMGPFEEVDLSGQLFTRARLLLDSKQRLWISGNKGLTVKDDTGHRTYDTGDDLADNNPYALYEDRQGNIWFGYHASRGVTVFNGETFKTYTMADGLSDDSVYLLGSDHHNQMWIGTTRGVDRFDGKVFTNYSTLEGFAGNECNSDAFVADSDGTLWLGTMTGLSHYFPDRDPIEKPATLSLAMRTGSLGEQPLRPNSVVDHHDNTLSMEVEVLCFKPRERVRVEYKLDGYDGKWHYLDGNRIYYTNLNPGPYQLHLRGTIYGQDWSRSQPLVFTIRPPLWQTWWFRGLSALLVFLIALSAYKLRVHNIKQTNRQLEGLVQERTQALRQEVQQRKRAQDELIAAQNELVEKAHQMGQADIAIGVMHNIGNLLCSLNISATIVLENLRQSKVSSLLRANKLLVENQDNLTHFLLDGDKGLQLVAYYQQLAKFLEKEHDENQDNTERLIDTIEAIRGYIITHQDYVTADSYEEALCLEDVLEDALSLQRDTLQRQKIELIINREVVPPVRAQTTKLIQILMNLLKNATEAINIQPPGSRRITIDIYAEEGRVCLSVSDNGAGVLPEHLNQIFSQGFTTKNHGHGFGLHSCANYMKEMGGNISVNSDGPNLGARFTLYFQRAENQLHLVRKTA